MDIDMRTKPTERRPPGGLDVINPNFVELRISSTDWFRSTAWTDAAQRDFRARIGRARPHNRIQYRRIKATVLFDTGQPGKIAGARGLLHEILEAPDAADFERVMALSMLGKEALDRGNLDDADVNLRKAIGLDHPTRSGTSGMEEVWLAQVALARGDDRQLAEARTLLEDRAADPPILLSARFEMCHTATRVALALHDASAAAYWARACLTLADAQHSGLRNHPTLGLVHLAEDTGAWLSGVADSPSRNR